MDNNLNNVIRATYRNIPYHNFEHAKKVVQHAKEIFQQSIQHTLYKNLIKKEPFKDEELLELLELAALFHDAGHMHIPTDNDEKYSAAIAEFVLNNINYSRTKIEYVKKLIMYTIFKDRGNIDNIMGKIIADADIANSFVSLDNFIEENIKLTIESIPQYEVFTEKYILRAMNKEGFINFLRQSSEDGGIFLLESSRNLYPNAENIVNDYFEIYKNNPKYIVGKVKEVFKKLYGFKLDLLDKR